MARICYCYAKLRLGTVYFGPRNVGGDGVFYPRAKPGNIKFSFTPTFPDHSDIPSIGKKFFFDAAVTLYVFFKFILPLFDMSFGDGCIFATSMAMPKAAMNKNGYSISGQNNIGRMIQNFCFQSIAESLAVEELSDDYFRLCVRRADSCHHTRASCGRDDIHVLFPLVQNWKGFNATYKNY